jgi:hypothetical protein
MESLIGLVGALVFIWSILAAPVPLSTDPG